MEGLAFTPTLCSEPLDSCVIDCLRVVRICLGVQKIVDVFSYD